MTHWYIRATSPVGTGTGRAEWAPNTAYVVGDRVICRWAYGDTSRRRNVYECTTGGTSHGSTEPTWPASGTVNDNGVVWTKRDPTTWANANIHLHWTTGTTYLWGAGDTIWIENTAVITYPADASMFGQYYYQAGSASVRTNLISTSDTAHEPPISRAAGAAVRCVGNLNVNECHGAYWYGVTFEAGYGAVGGTPSWGVASWTNAGYTHTFEECTIRLAYGSSGCRIKLTDNNSSYDAQSAMYINCQFLFTHASQRMEFGHGTSRIYGGSVALSGTVPTCPFEISAARSVNMQVIGMDLSACSSNICDLTRQGEGIVVFSRCKLNASVVVFSGRPYVPDVYGIAELCSAVSGVNYRSNIVGMGGTLDDDETNVRTGGASDGTTPIAWKVTTIAGCGIPIAFKTPWITIWQNDVGSSVTYTVEILHDSTTNLKDNEVWLEALVLTNASFPQAEFCRDRNIPGFASADQATSSATWTTTGLTNPNRQKLSITVTPQMKGVVTFRVAVAKSNKVVYIDPMITVS